MVHPYNEIFRKNKRDELSYHQKTQLNLKCMLLTEGSYPKYTTYCIIPIKWHLEKAKIQRQEKI